MKIGFIGVGKLGKDAAEIMAEKHNVIGYDVNTVEPANFNMVNSIEEVCKDRELIFIAVPTPHHPDYDGREPTSHLPNKDFNSFCLIPSTNFISCTWFDECFIEI